jgi:hypothetical protein
MIVEEHRERHRELHKSLDELLADFISHHPKIISATQIPIMDLMI